MNPDDVRRGWAERSGEFSPEYYAQRGADWMTDAVRELLEHYVGHEGRVLEVGCSSGRHLAALHDAGFEDLHGVELNGEALEVMAERYPSLAGAGTFYIDDAGALLPEFEDDAFDAVFTVETLQHIHPDEADHVFDEVARVTDDLLVTVENETARASGDADDPEISFVNDEFPLYHRDWQQVFAGRGFAQVVIESGKRDQLRAFRRP